MHPDFALMIFLVLRKLVGRFLVGAVLLLVLAVTIPRLSAQSTWVGAANGSWGAATNWSPATVPNASDAVATFNSAVGPTVNSAAYTVGTLNFSGGTSTLNGAGTLTARVSTGTPVINIASGCALYFYTSLGGSQGYTKTGGGSLTFRYSNTAQPVAGPITIAAGTLGIQADYSLGNTNNPVFIAGGASLSEQNSGGLGTYTLAPSRTLTLAGNPAQIGVYAGETLIIPGVVMDSPAGQPLVFNSAGGTLILAGTNIYSGGTTLTAGTLSVGTAASLGAAGSGLTFNGGTLQITGTNWNSFSGGSHPPAFATGKTVVLDINAASNTFKADAPLNQGTGGLTKLGAGTLLLTAASTYTGPTLVNVGTLALASSGSLNSLTPLSLAAGASFDVSAAGSYTFGAAASLTASGNATPATLLAAPGGTINLGTAPLTLNIDGTDPALLVSQGGLNLGGQTITVNSSVPLTNGSYNLIQVSRGSLAHAGNYTLAGTATNGATGALLGFATNGGSAWLQLTLTGSTNGASAPDPYSDLSSNQADAFEGYLLANQGQYPNDFYLAVPGDDASVASYVSNLGTDGRFADITYPTSSTATVVQGGGGWMVHLPRLYAIYKALIATNSNYFLNNHPALLTNLLPRLVTATTAYTHVPWDITDQWNYCHTWADLCEVYALGSVCLYSRQVNRLAPGTIQVPNIDAWGNRIPDLFRNGHIDTNYMVPPNGFISAAHLPFLWSGGNMIWTSQGIVLKYLTQSTNAVRLEGLDATFAHIWNGCSLIGPKHEAPTGIPGYTAIPQMTTDYMLGEHSTPYLLVYGGTFLNGMIQWRNGMANFPRWSMPPTNRINQRFADCVINGVAPLNQGYPDRILLSRGLTSSAEYSPTYNLTTWINDILGFGYHTNELSQLLAWNNNNNPGTNPWPFTNNTFTHFYSSDYSCQHFPHFLVTFRGVSQRTCAIENLQSPLAGYFPQGRQLLVPLGGSYIYGTGQEYGAVNYNATGATPWENACDYTRIPGVTTKTVPDSAFTNSWRYVFGNRPFAGTAAALNSGVSGWEQARFVQTDTWNNPISLAGNVAVFYLDMAVVHLGAGFDTTQDAYPTITSLNQCLSATNVITYGLTNGTTASLPGSGGALTNAAINWALYQGVGYLPPANGVKILRDVTQNNAARVFSFYADQSNPTTNNLTFDWAVLPGVSPSTLAAYATPANRPWIIVTNTAALQALSVPAENWLGAVFHDASAILYATGLTVSVSRPTVLLITTQTNQLATIYAADPFENMVAPYTNTVVPFTNAAQLVSQVTVTINGRAFPLTLPPRPNLGMTVTATVSLSPSNLAPVIVTPPLSTNALLGSLASFTVAAAGTPDPAYQWWRNGLPLAGATSATCAFLAGAGDNGASFTCVVSNSAGVVTSPPAFLAVNDQPVISPIPDQLLNRNGASQPLAFTVSDLLTPPASLVVTATSANPILVPNASLVLGGSGTNRTLTLTPASNQTGYAAITVSVSNGTLANSTALLVTVVSNNLPPVLLPLANRTVIGGASLAVASQASDPNTPPQPLGYDLPIKPAGAGINPASGLITWRPLVAHSGSSNQFTVVVTNTSSLAATQNFYVGVLPPQQPVMSAATAAGGGFHFTIAGDAGPDYTIQGTTNLTTPWQSLVTSNAPTPPFPWTDTNALRSQYYYRILIGP